MTSSHKHGTGKLATAGDVDARLAALERRVLTLECHTHEPVPEPEPEPEPEPARPFAAPVTTRTVTAPLSGLNAFVQGLGDGTEVVFPTGAVYSLAQGLLISGKANIVLRGNGATIRVAGPDGDLKSPFTLRGSSHIAIEDFTVEGGYTGFPGQQGEISHGLSLSGWYGGPPSSYVEMTRVEARNLYGDGVYLEGENVGARRPSSFVWVHDCSFTTMGRNGLSLINATDVWFEDNELDDMAYHAVDVEQNFAAERVERITVQRNRFGSYAHRAGLLGFFVSDAQIGTGVGALTGRMDITDNTVAGIPANGYDGQPRGLDSRFIGTPTVKHGPIRFVGNTSPIVRPSPVYARDATVVLS